MLQCLPRIMEQLQSTATGSFTYTSHNYVGADNFSYTLTNTAGSDSATVTDYGSKPPSPPPVCFLTVTPASGGSAPVTFTTRLPEYTHQLDFNGDGRNRQHMTNPSIYLWRTGIYTLLRYCRWPRWQTDSTSQTVRVSRACRRE